MIRIVTPLTDAAAREWVTVAPFPLADALCALWLIANNLPGTPRLSALRDRLTVQDARVIAAWFGPPLPLGLLALALAATADDWAGLRTTLRDTLDTDTIAFALTLAGALAADAPCSPGVYRSLMLDADWAHTYVHRYLVPAPANPVPLLATITAPPTHALASQTHLRHSSLRISHRCSPTSRKKARTQQRGWKRH